MGLWSCNHWPRDGSIGVVVGIGIANAAGKGGSSLSGFGVVTMASLPHSGRAHIAFLFPSQLRLMKLLLQNSEQRCCRAAIDGDQPIGRNSAGVRAILPLVLFLMLSFVVLKSTLPNKMVTVYGLAL